MIEGWLRSALQKPTFQLVVLSCLSQAISVLATPGLARLYDPVDFGLLGVFGSTSVILVCVASWRYEQAIPTCKHDQDAAPLLWLCLILNCLSGLVVLLSQRLGPAVYESLHILPLWDHAWLLAPGLFGSSAYTIIEMLAIRKRAFLQIGMSRVLQTSTALLAQVFLVHNGHKLDGLIVGQVLGNAAGGLTLLACLVRALGPPNVAEMARVAKRYVRFPLYGIWGSIARACAAQSPIIFLAEFFGPAVAGWLTLSQRLVTLPATILGEALARVFLGNAAPLWHEDHTRFRRLLYLTLRRQFLTAICLGTLIVVLAPWAFVAILGAKWRDAGVFSQILCLGAMGQFLSQPFEHIVDLAEQQPLFTAREILRAGLLMGTVLWVTKFAANPDPIFATWAVSISTLSYSLLSLAITYFCVVQHAQRVSQG